MSDSKKHREFVGGSIAGKPVEAIPGIGTEIGKRMRETNKIATVSYEELVKFE